MNANCEPITRTYTVTTGVNLTLSLSKEEAERFMGALRHVGGQPSGTRGLFDCVYAALEEAGVEYQEVPHSSVLFLDD